MQLWGKILIGSVIALFIAFLGYQFWYINYSLPEPVKNSSKPIYGEVINWDPITPALTIRVTENNTANHLKATFDGDKTLVIVTQHGGIRCSGISEEEVLPEEQENWDNAFLQGDQVEVRSDLSVKFASGQTVNYPVSFVKNLTVRGGCESW